MFKLKVIFIFGLVICFGTACSSASKQEASTTRATRITTTTKASNSTFLGPEGVEASWVVNENKKPGTASWQIQSTRGPSISGYANTTAAYVGNSVKIYVSTQAPYFTIAAYRMGYYGGDFARLIWQSGQYTGINQPTCPLVSGINMITCNWTNPVTVNITAAWVQGDYLLKLSAVGGQQSYVPLTIVDPTSSATYVIDNSVFTWQAWNNYGGYDMYGGAAPGQGATYDNRARVMSFDRPYATGEGAGDFLGNELPLVEYVEQHGLDVTYWTDVYFSENPQLLLNHKVYLSLGHAECWDNQERAEAVTGIAKGVNFIFFGASPILRHVRLQPGPNGTADREMVDYRDPTEDPLYGKNNAWVTGNTWAQPPTNLPASQIVGNTYGGYDINAPMIIVDASAWPFKGTNVTNGFQLPHVVQFDFDHFVPGQEGPSNVQILAHSPVTTSYGVRAYADMTYYTDSQSNAGVIATGTNFWIASMTPCQPTTNCPASVVRAITGNILYVFGQGPAGLKYPSQTNWQQFYP
jgi:hypothetical protein